MVKDRRDWGFPASLSQVSISSFFKKLCSLSLAARPDQWSLGSLLFQPALSLPLFLLP